MKENKSVEEKEIGYMKKGGAPKSMIREEESEHREMRREHKKEEKPKKSLKEFKGKNY